jgi:predicted CoA-binding protein
MTKSAALPQTDQEYSLKSKQTSSPDAAKTINEILERYRTVAVVGLSPKPHRDSYGVARYMQAQGWRIIPINPSATEILGETAYPSLTEAARHHKIELVNVFRKSADVPPVVDEAIAVGAKAIWLQLGVENDAAVAKATQANLAVVQDKCLKVEHAHRR